MPIDFEYNSAKNTLDLKVTGILKSSEIIDYFQKLLEGEFLEDGFMEIVDLNKTTDFLLRYTDLEIIEDLTKKLNNIGQKATIMCGYNEVSKGISSMMLPLYQRADFTFFICESESELRTFMKSLE